MNRTALPNPSLKQSAHGGPPGPVWRYAVHFELAFREEGTRVTLALSKSSVDFFKLEASKRQIQYQRMIGRPKKGPPFGFGAEAAQTNITRYQPGGILCRTHLSASES